MSNPYSHLGGRAAQAHVLDFCSVYFGVIE